MVAVARIGTEATVMGAPSQEPTGLNSPTWLFQSLTLDGQRAGADKEAAWVGVTGLVELQLTSILHQLMARPASSRWCTDSFKVLAIATDVFTDIDVFQDVLDASISRRVPVYILLDSLNAPLFEEMCRKLNVPIHQLDNLRVRTIAGVPFHCKSGIKFLGQMFEKFLLVDCHTVLCGTYSFTWSFEKIHRSVAHVFTGTAASDFDEEFRLLYAQSQAICPEQPPPSIMARSHYSFHERASMQPYKTAQASPQVPLVCFQSPNYLQAIPPYLAAEESFESSSGSSWKAMWKGPWGEKPSRFKGVHFTQEDAFEKTKNNRIGYQWHNPANWGSGGDWPTEQETWQGSGQKGNDSNMRQPFGERKTVQGQMQWGWEYLGKPGLQVNSRGQNRFESPYFPLAHRMQFEDTAKPKVAPGGFRPLCLNSSHIAQAQQWNETFPGEVSDQKNVDMQWNSVHTQWNTGGLPDTQLLPAWLNHDTSREWLKCRPRTAEGNLRPRPWGNDDTNAQECNLHRTSRLRSSLIYHSLPRLPARSRFTGKHHLDVKGKVSAMQEIPHENDREETIAARLNNQPVENKTPIYNRGPVLEYARNYRLNSQQKTLGIQETSLSSRVQVKHKMITDDDRAVSKVHLNNFKSNEELQKQSRIDKPTTLIEAIASEEKEKSSEQRWEGKFSGMANEETRERVMEYEGKHDNTTTEKPAGLGSSLIVLLQRSNLKDDTKALLKDMSAKGQQQAVSATIQEEKANERQVRANTGGEYSKELIEMVEDGGPKAENLLQRAEVMRRDNRVFSRFEVLMNPDGEKEDSRETSISKQEASEIEDANKDVGKRTDDEKKFPDTRYINTPSGHRASVRDRRGTSDLRIREEKSHAIEPVDKRKVDNDIPGRRCKVKISPGRRHPERCRPGYGLAAQGRSSLLENYWKR
uniref:uncharacterized protein isoform X2 n=1 Tax=Myxine glutinosa TaxID=7769 RepID=UPI00358E6FF6